MNINIKEAAVAEPAFKSIKAAIDRLLTPYWIEGGHGCTLGHDWWVWYAGAECISQDCVLTFECGATRGLWEVPAPSVRTTLRRAGQDDTVWVLAFHGDGRLINVEGARADVLADVLWRMVRLTGEGAVEGDLISRPAEWHEAYRPPAEAA